MKRNNRIARTATACVSVLLAAATLSGCFYSTGPNEVGIRTRKGIIGSKGVDEHVYQRGATHILMPFINDWHTLNVGQQNLELTASVGRGDRRGRDDLTFKTIDGNDISLDIIVTYQVQEEKAAYLIQYVASNDEDLKEFIVRTVARSLARDIFGELTTEEFYTASERTKKAQKVLEEMNNILLDYGVVVKLISPKAYRFNPAYQQAIEDKKVADQQVEKNKAAANAAEKEYEKRVEIAKGDVAKTIAAADGEYKRAIIEADAYYEQQKSLSKAIEVEGRAQAEAIREMNEALAGSGGEAMVKLAIAEALIGKRIIVLPMGGGGLDIRTTDINALLELYGIQKIIGAGKKR